MRSIWALPEDQWERDQHEYRFMPRALNDIGIAIFGEAWTGEEFVPNSARKLPASSDEQANDRARTVAARFIEAAIASELRTVVRSLQAADVRPVRSADWSVVPKNVATWAQIDSAEPIRARGPPSGNSRVDFQARSGFK